MDRARSLGGIFLIKWYCDYKLVPRIMFLCSQMPQHINQEFFLKKTFVYELKVHESLKAHDTARL